MVELVKPRTSWVDMSSKIRDEQLGGGGGGEREQVDPGGGLKPNNLSFNCLTWLKL